MLKTDGTESLCLVVSGGENAHNRMKRLADISDGTLYPFQASENDEKIFQNRDILYYSSDDHVEIGEIGIWRWEATPNLNKPERDFINSEFIRNKKPIELIEIQGQTSLTSLVSFLKNNIPGKLDNSKLLFYFQEKDNFYKGVLCENSDIEEYNGKSCLSKNCTLLPVCTFCKDDFFIVEQNRKFYRNLTIIPNDTVLISPERAIKEILLSRISKKNTHGLKRDERQCVKDFLCKIPDLSFEKEVAERLQRSENYAKWYIQNFIERINEIIDEKSIDDEIIEKIVENQVDLHERYENKIYENWQKQNSQKFAEVTRKLNEIEAQVEQKKEKLQSIQDDIKRGQELLEKQRKELTQGEMLEENIRRKIQTRIQKERENVADFLSEFVMMNPISSESKLSQITTYHEGETLEITHNFTAWDEFIDVFQKELEKAGIEPSLCEIMAGFLYSCWLHRVPVLLAGPCGEYIANAFSSLMFGKTAGVLNCIDKYHPEKIQEMLESRDEIVIIQNPFQAEWVEHIPSLLLPEKKHYFLTYPFAEDLSIEPRSLYHYMLPVLTELFISQPPCENFIAGKCSDEFEEFECNTKLDKIPVLEHFQTSLLFLNRLKSVLTDAKELTVKTGKMDLYLGILPYIIVTGQQEKFMEKVFQDHPFTREEEEFVMDYLGIKE